MNAAEPDGRGDAVAVAVQLVEVANAAARRPSRRRRSPRGGRLGGIACRPTRRPGPAGPARRPAPPSMRRPASRRQAIRARRLADDVAGLVGQVVGVPHEGIEGAHRPPQARRQEQEAVIEVPRLAPGELAAEPVAGGERVVMAPPSPGRGRSAAVRPVGTPGSPGLATERAISRATEQPELRGLAHRRPSRTDVVIPALRSVEDRQPPAREQVDVDGQAARQAIGQRRGPLGTARGSARPRIPAARRTRA